ncbi:hypothetical protein FB451DRAFT_1404409 [Mycena latifolia]|nr:hypothetical protein FB451DRAFT_1404409 [Mycena latifolia]
MMYLDALQAPAARPIPPPSHAGPAFTRARLTSDQHARRVRGRRPRRARAPHATPPSVLGRDVHTTRKRPYATVCVREALNSGARRRVRLLHAASLAQPAYPLPPSLSHPRARTTRPTLCLALLTRRSHFSPVLALLAILGGALLAFVVGDFAYALAEVGYAFHVITRAHSFLTVELAASWHTLRALDAEDGLSAWKLDSGCSSPSIPRPENIRPHT